MLQRLDDFKGLKLHATDGQLGRVSDFQFDDGQWAVRYLVVRTEPWLGRNVLISPISAGQLDWVDSTLEVRLTRDQIRHSPEVPLSNPLAPRSETDYASYYGYSDYWSGPQLWGWADFPSALAGPPPDEHAAATAGERGVRACVRSVRVFRGIHLHARDGEIGHVDDAFIDDETWHIRYLLVDTSNWIGGTHVPVPTSAIGAVDWTGGRIDVDLTRDRIRLAPPYDPARPLDRIVEQALERHYNVESLGRRPLSRTAGS
jgi:sporulation protein YlmC with PRC-barrel domain